MGQVLWQVKRDAPLLGRLKEVPAFVKPQAAP